MTVIVSDTSPVRALYHLGLLSILAELYGHVLVPPAVQRELDAPLPQFERVDLSGLDFIEVRAPQDSVQVQLFLQSLDLGESEALALALELRAAAVLIDEIAGRKTAASIGIRFSGDIGCFARSEGERSHSRNPTVGGYSRR